MNDKSSDNLGHRLRLRDRFLNGGVSALAEYEIVELVLMFAIPRKDVKPIAKKLIQKYGGLKQILNADKNELMGLDSALPFADSGKNANRTRQR